MHALEFFFFFLPETLLLTVGQARLTTSAESAEEDQDGIKLKFGNYYVFFFHAFKEKVNP